MAADKSDQNLAVRYEADESPPIAISFGLGLQLAILCIASIVLTPAIVIRAAGGSEAYLSWALFAAVAISGLTTILQAVRLGRLGAGYVLLMGTSGAFIAICVTAIAEGGPALLATLVVISALFQFTLSSRLSLLRRILTPTVAGTVIMLIAVTVMPIVFDMLTEVPEGSPTQAATLSALVTIAVIVGIGLKARGALLVVAHKEAGEAVMEFVAAPGTANLEDRIALLGEQTAAASFEREVSLRLLRHLASSVRHQQFHDTDIVTIRVTPPEPIPTGSA